MKSLFIILLYLLNLASDLVFIYCLLTWLIMPLNRLIDHGVYKTVRLQDNMRRICGGILRFLQKFLNGAFSLLQKLVEPLLSPFRRLLNIMFGYRSLPMDLSPLLLFFAVRIGTRILYALLSLVW